MLKVHEKYVPLGDYNSTNCKTRWMVVIKLQLKALLKLSCNAVKVHFIFLLINLSSKWLAQKLNFS